MIYDIITASDKRFAQVSCGRSSLVYPTPLKLLSLDASRRLETCESEKHVSVSTAACLRAPAAATVDYRSVLLASLLSAIVLYPLDLMRALMMAEVSNARAQRSLRILVTDFVNSHGITALFTLGASAELLKAAWIRFLKFYLHPLLVSNLEQFRFPLYAGSSGLQIIAALLSAIPETAVAMPLEVAKMQLQLDDDNRYLGSICRVLSITAAKFGILTIFRTGFFATLYRQSSWSVAYYIVSPIAKRILLMSGAVANDNIARALSGFLAGIIGTVFNTPGDIVRSTIQIKFYRQGVGALHYETLDTIRYILATRGWRGFYSGFILKATCLGLGGALMSLLIPFIQNKLG